MRITIEIDGAEAALKTGQTGDTAVGGQAAPASGQAGVSTVPADFLARAAAMGALDGGPAPSAAGPASEPMQFTSVGPGTLMGSAGDISAGTAPGFAGGHS